MLTVLICSMESSLTILKAAERKHSAWSSNSPVIIINMNVNSSQQFIAFHNSSLLPKGNRFTRAHSATEAHRPRLPVPLEAGRFLPAIGQVEGDASLSV